MSQSATIHISVENQSWNSFDYKSVILPVIKETLDSLSIDSPVEISILLSGDEKMQSLNKEHREKDKPTNVLSFPLTEPEELEKILHQPYINENSPIMLGDVALSLETIKREAVEQEKDFEHHLAHLVAHGLLHLLGYDHLVEEEADEMEGLEVKILMKFNIRNPYER